MAMIISGITKGNGKPRQLYIDTLKLFAIFHIFLKHFVSRFHKEYSHYWHIPPMSWIFEGITGKCCVAFLGVCLGYFAYKCTEKRPTVYIVRRYCFFFICGLLINTIRVVLNSAGLLNLSVEINGFWDALRIISVESLCLGRKLFVTFWCMLPFFVSSVLSYINGRANVKAVGLIVQIAFCMILNQVWIAVCMIGAVVAALEKEEKVGKLFGLWYIRVLVFVACFFAVKRSETDITYLIDGICSGLIMLIFLFWPKLQRVFSIPFFASQGKNLIAIYLIHTTVYNTVGKWLFEVIAFPRYCFTFITVMACCWIIIVLLSYPLTYLINKLVYWITRLIKRPCFASL